MADPSGRTGRVPRDGKGRELFTVHPDIAAGGLGGAVYRTTRRAEPAQATEPRDDSGVPPAPRQ